MTKKTEKGWLHDRTSHSLPEVYSSIRVPTGKGFWKKLLAFSGPGLMVAVGYMDPGNWATDLAGGSKFGYMLLSVILISNVMAIILQHLSLKLGVVTGRDLAQACRDNYSRPVSFILWILCELAIAACDLAEVIGTAIALNLLFGIPLVWGVVITAADVLVVLLLQKRGFRYLESIVAGLILLIGGCFLYEIIASQPQITAILGGFIPSPEIIFNPSALYISIGILGATVMPHNLYLHSSIVQTRNFERSSEGKKMAIKFATIDSTVALLFAFCINAAILILAAATFFGKPGGPVEDIAQAHQLLSPALGVPLASMVFAIALLASGQNSTLTGTLAGQIVMQGFLNITLPPWLRRLVTRLIAVVPAIIVTSLFGNVGATSLLVFSQVILSMQLGFAVVPLVAFTANRTKMGQFVNARWLTVLAWTIAGVIICLNAYLLIQTVASWFV